MLQELIFWSDLTPRTGFENMAVDQWLLETSQSPVFREYRWEAGWGSCGYFVPRADLPPEPLRWVRRWTGGGIVDHRCDRTYTLVIPRGLALAEMRGGGSYRFIHQALAAHIPGAGLSASTPSAPGGECFIRPVEYDVLDAGGRKISGAGQRRTVRGLLHQGSVLSTWPVDLGAVAADLAEKVIFADLNPPEEEIGLLAENYRSDAWWNRR